MRNSLMLPTLALAMLLGLAGCRGGDSQTTGVHEQPETVTPGILDGRTYVGETGIAGRSKTDPETITFEAGSFHSRAFDRQRFNRAPYLALAADGKVAFTARTTNRKGETIIWQGTVIGDVLDAAGTKYEKGIQREKYWTKARLK